MTLTPAPMTLAPAPMTLAPAPMTLAPAPMTLAPAPMTLAICEIFHPVLHGHDEYSTPTINQHFLIYTTVELSDFYNNAYKSEERSIRRYRKAVALLHNDATNDTHPLIRGYNAVAQKCIRLEIIQSDELRPGQEAVAYLKTFWLRIVQRCWKKVFKQRKAVLLGRMNIKSRQEQQRTGQYPPAFRHLPPFRLNLFYTF